MTRRSRKPRMSNAHRSRTNRSWPAIESGTASAGARRISMSVWRVGPERGLVAKKRLQAGDHVGVGGAPQRPIVEQLLERRRTPGWHWRATAAAAPRARSRGSGCRPSCRPGSPPPTGPDASASAVGKRSTNAPSVRSVCSSPMRWRTAASAWAIARGLTCCAVQRDDAMEDLVEQAHRVELRRVDDALRVAVPIDAFVHLRRRAVGRRRGRAGPRCRSA